MKSLVSRMTLIAGACALLACSVKAGQVDLKVAVSHPVMLADQKQTAYLRIGLTGLPVVEATQRAPVNVAIVLDRSGSMSGRKLSEAKQAAILAIGQLGADDIVSVVTYDNRVNVLVPATKVSDRHTINAAIRRIRSGGSTALFAGVSKGASEVRKFLSSDRANRVILLSDGLANVGPSSPEALASLGTSLIKEGISVTTIGLGLGYNEDLMYRLASASDGKHVFVEHPSQLASIFKREFGDLLSVVANEILVEISCAEGIRPVRVFARDADITGQRVTTKLSQLYGRQEKYVLMEVEVPGMPEGKSRPIADVNVNYNNVVTKGSVSLSGSAKVAFSRSSHAVSKRANTKVMVSAVEQVAVDNNIRAMRLRDQGKVAEARKLLLSNEKYLNDNAARYKNEKLRTWGAESGKDADNLSPEKWKSRRKQMREIQFDMAY